MGQRDKTGLSIVDKEIVVPPTWDKAGQVFVASTKAKNDVTGGMPENRCP